MVQPEIFVLAGRVPPRGAGDPIQCSYRSLSRTDFVLAQVWRLDMISSPSSQWGSVAALLSACKVLITVFAIRQGKIANPACKEKTGASLLPEDICGQGSLTSSIRHQNSILSVCFAQGALSGFGEPVLVCGRSLAAILLGCLLRC